MTTPRRRLRNWILLAGLLAAGLWAGRAIWRLPPTRFFPPPRLSPTAATGTPAAPVQRAKVLFIGHSLINREMPAMLRDIAASRGCELSFDVELRSGAILKLGWEGQLPIDGVRAREALATGGYDTLVLTEAVDLDDMLRWMQSAEYAGRYQRLAVQHNPAIRVFLYETWHDRELVRHTWYGAARKERWREFLDEDLGKWESIATGAAAHAGQPRMSIVPGGQALARLNDAIAAGEVPGITSAATLFTDGIHLAPLGNYFIALVQFAAIHRQTPVGATTTPRSANGARIEFPAATAAAMQRIAWDAVASYAWSGVRAGS
ncbi:MAG: hypothetical protein MUC36_06685 [Planctomycetes bacterium]|jgi:hypothetical protein|nr:hypothetical protein [Planctomycetota bacterium]